MKEAISINRNAEGQNSLDFHELRKEGIELVQGLAGDIWTDYNEHDPGVTILEQLCYSLTDLGYRTSFDIKDLLRAKRAKHLPDEYNAFYDPASILPCNPTNLTDLRMQIIDGISEVKNVWFEAVKDNIQGIKGLYRVLLQLDEEPEKKHDKTQEEVDEVVKKVWQLYQKFRNLCEDVDSIEVLQAERITIHADIHLSPDSIPESVLAELYFELEDYLIPKIRYYSLKELMEQGFSHEQIFDGPAPIHGFINSKELKSLPTEVYISKLIEIISKIPGVMRIQNFEVRQQDFPVEGDVITIKEGFYPALDARFDHYMERDLEFPVRFFRGQVQNTLDLNTTAQLIFNREASYQREYQLKLAKPLREVSDLEKKDLERYYSLQRIFPKTYGISEYGLPAHSRRDRRAYAKQLKGYLLVFEQFIANYLSQFSRLEDLFAVDESIDRSYFYQVPEDIPGLEDLYDGDKDDFKRSLAEVTKKNDPFIDRRNRFLDHLMARFSESFHTDFLIRNKSYESAGNVDRDLSEMDLIRSKIQFLKNYPMLSRDRGKGFNYTKDSWETDNVAALKKRVCLMLNIADFSDRFLTDAVDDEGFDVLEVEGEDVQELVGKLAAAEEADTYSYFGLKEEDKETMEEGTFVFSSDDPQLLKLLLRYGTYDIYYDFSTTAEGKTIITFALPGKESSRIYEAANQKAAKEALEDLKAYLSDINKKGEGFHLVEHLLLRPLSPEKFNFNFLDDKSDIILKSFAPNEMSRQRLIVDDLLIVGIKPENYIISPTEGGSLSVFLSDEEGQLIVRLNDEFDTEEEAHTKIAEVIDHLLEIKKDNVTLYTRVEFYSEGNLVNDFYSLKLAAVLPAWPARFQNNDFKILFEEIFNSSAPAHLVIEYLWLDIAEMEEFEVIYKSWLEEKVKAAPNLLYLDKLSLEIVNLISNHEDNL